jgi:FAD/FMN-containing dehydrogenase
MTLDEADMDALSHIVGIEHVVRGAGLARLERGIDPENFGSSLVVRPGTVAEVQAIVRWCAERAVSIVPLGGRTGLSGGGASHEGQVSVLMDRLDRVLRVSPFGDYAVVESGATLGAVEAALAPHGLSAGINLSARDSCTIGGLVANNAGGMESFRNGTMRQRVLGLEAVLPDGSLFEDLTVVLKTNAGYDLKHLFIGSEGTLGLITKVALKLTPVRQSFATFLLSFGDTRSAQALVSAARRATHFEVLRCEAMWRRHFVETCELLELDALGRFGEAGEVFLILELGAPGTNSGDADASGAIFALCEGLQSFVDGLELKSEREVREVWRVREDWAIDRRYPNGLWFDVSICPDEIDAYLARVAEDLARLDPALRLYAIGHLADANLHVTVNADVDLAALKPRIEACVYRGIRETGGCFSAEHGIGTAKKHALAEQVSPAKLDMMRKIKRALDPQNIMNPGKVVD